VARAGVDGLPGFYVDENAEPIPLGLLSARHGGRLDAAGAEVGAYHDLRNIARSGRVHVTTVRRRPALAVGVRPYRRQRCPPPGRASLCVDASTGGKRVRGLKPVDERPLVGWPRLSGARPLPGRPRSRPVAAGSLSPPRYLEASTAPAGTIR
jgi:hypothetical protein